MFLEKFRVFILRSTVLTKLIPAPPATTIREKIRRIFRKATTTTQLESSFLTEPIFTSYQQETNQLGMQKQKVQQA